MQTLLQDLRYAVRLIFKQPGVAAVTIISLALAIGANTAIFTLVNSALLRPLPVEEPNQLLRVFLSYQDGPDYGAFSHRDYLNLREKSGVFSGLAAQREAVFGLGQGAEIEPVQGVVVSGNYFDVLRVKPAAGRAFLPEEDSTPGSHPVAVISHRLWGRRFTYNPNVVGMTLTLNGHNFTVIGVAPESFTGTELGYAPEVYVPLMMQAVVRPGASIDDPTARWLYPLGRLKPGVTEAQAEAGLGLLVSQLAQESATKLEGATAVVAPATASHPEMRKAFVPLAIVLLAVVGLVLLIACANVANLLLSKASARRREIGIRLAMGATRGRLIRQLVTESLLLSLVGGAIGLLLAFWATDFLLAFTPPTDFRVALDLRPDYRVLVFTFVVALLAGTLFGLVPALQATKPDLVEVLKKSDDSSYGFRKSRLRNTLIVTQITLALMLLICTGLFLKSLRNAHTLNPGFETENVLLTTVNMNLHAYEEPQALVFYDQLLERVKALPGVRGASLAEKVFGDDQQIGVVVEGYTPPPDTDLIIDYNIVAPEYFQTMGLPLTRGRDFSPRDTKDSPGVVIINERMAQRFWPGEDAIGKRLSVSGTKGPYLEVIGVVKNAKYYDLQEQPFSYLYLPYKQHYESRATLHVRTAGDPAALTGAVRRQVQELDQHLPVFGLTTLSDHMSRSLWAPRMAATLLGIFGGLALVLAVVGVYAVVSYAVIQRTNEIGIRMALGAPPRDMLLLLLRQSMKLTLIGLVIGLVLAFVLARFASSLLYGVSASDPIVFAGIPLILGVVTLLASYIPARRAMHINPVVALRYE
jgi:macrolide transport system ATP-binding/permease protein